MKATRRQAIDAVSRMFQLFLVKYLHHPLDRVTVTQLHTVKCSADHAGALVVEL